MKKIGLALSSGGARGSAHIGVIRILQKNNIPINMIAGTSMGSVVAAYYALNLEVKGLEKRLLNLKRKNIIRMFVPNRLKNSSLFKSRNVMKFLNEMFEGKTFRHTKIPLIVTATVLEDGSLIEFKSGKIADAVMASITIPGIMPVVKYKGNHLVDGALAQAVPVDIVRRMGADKIIAVDLTSLEKLDSFDPKFRSVMSRTYDLLISNLANQQLKSYDQNVLILKPKTGSKVRVFSFRKTKRYLSAGEKAAQNNMEKIKVLIK